jgi:hypothetical protein
MSHDSRKTLEELLAPMLKNTLFVVSRVAGVSSQS